MKDHENVNPTEADVDWSEGVSDRLASVPGDLVVVAAYVIAVALARPFVASTPLRAVVVAPLLLFVPGYLFVSAAYPRRYDATGVPRGAAASADEASAAAPDHSESGIRGVERLVLSVGMTVAVLPLVGAATWALVGSLSARVGLFGLVAVSLAFGAAATLRRRRVPAAERFRTGPLLLGRRLTAALDAPSTGGRLVNAFLAVAVLVATASMAYAFAVPTDGESYTTATLVTERDGEYVADGYPTSFTAGEPRQLTLQVTNHERAETAYTVAVGVEAVAETGDDPTVTEWSEQERLQFALRPGETVRRDHAVAPAMVGEDRRLSYYLYRGDAPAEPSADSAYRSLHLWIDVTP